MFRMLMLSSYLEMMHTTTFLSLTAQTLTQTMNSALPRQNSLLPISDLSTFPSYFRDGSMLSSRGLRSPRGVWRVSSYEPSSLNLCVLVEYPHTLITRLSLRHNRTSRSVSRFRSGSWPVEQLLDFGQHVSHIGLKNASNKTKHIAGQLWCPHGAVEGVRESIASNTSHVLLVWSYYT